jgi:hypothetical protein
MKGSQEELKKVLLQIRETLNDHRHVRLSRIFKEKQCLEARIGDFDIDYVVDEETQVNIMTENVGSYRESCYDSFTRRNRNIQMKVDKPIWKAHLDTYECQWNFDRGRF